MEKEFLLEELKRVSQFVKFADVKTVFLWSLYIAITVWAFTVKDIILGFLYGRYYIYLIIALIIIWYYFLLKSILPRIDNKPTSTSFFYFGTVRKMWLTNFLRGFDQLTDAQIKKQLIEQIYINSEIADIKMRNIRYASYSPIMIVILGILIFWINQFLV